MQMTKTTNAQSSTHHPQATTNRPSTSKKQRFQAIKTSSQKKMIRFRNINHKTLALYDKTCNFVK